MSKLSIEKTERGIQVKYEGPNPAEVATMISNVMQNDNDIKTVIFAAVEAVKTIDRAQDEIKHQN